MNVKNCLSYGLHVQNQKSHINTRTSNCSSIAKSKLMQTILDNKICEVANFYPVIYYPSKVEHQNKKRKSGLAFKALQFGVYMNISNFWS